MKEIISESYMEVCLLSLTFIGVRASYVIISDLFSSLWSVTLIIFFPESGYGCVLALYSSVLSFSRY